MDQAAQIDRLRHELERVAVEADAAPMAAYMKDRFRFLGVKTPARRRASKQLITASTHEPVDEVVACAHELRAQPEREFHYVAGDLLRANRQRLRADHLADIEHFVTTDSWWDTVDALASPTVGTMVRAHPDLLATLDRWIDADDFWLARVAILHQLRFGADTDADRLFRYSTHRAGDAEFFIRKAIGWALREYSRTDPDAVRTYVETHREVLAPLTAREATRRL